MKPVLMENAFEAWAAAIRFCDDRKTLGVRPHKEKINISKEIINKTRRAVAPYAARMNHTSLRGEQQATVLWLAEM